MPELRGSRNEFETEASEGDTALTRARRFNVQRQRQSAKGSQPTPTIERAFLPSPTKTHFRGKYFSSRRVFPSRATKFPTLSVFLSLVSSRFRRLSPFDVSVSYQPLFNRRNAPHPTHVRFFNAFSVSPFALTPLSSPRRFAFSRVPSLHISSFLTRVCVSGAQVSSGKFS